MPEWRRIINNAYMKRIGGILLLMLASACGYAQNANDPIVMTINGENVARSEFERAYNRNKASGTSVKEYVDLYINYRLKIAEALKQRIDTAKEFRQEFATYRNDLLAKYVTDTQFEDSIVRSIYDRMKTQLKDSDILSVSHIFVSVPQKASDKQKAAAKARIDSIYSVLKSGADFAEVAKACSQDIASARRGGELPDIGPGATLKEFEDKCYTLKAGEMSEPFESTAGYHIVLMRARAKLQPYEQKKDELVKILNPQGLQQMVFNHAVEKLVKASGGKTRDEVLDQIEKEHEGDDATLKYVTKDYREGLLAYNITKQEVWDKAEKDVKGQEAFFKKNKKNYQWDSPRYKGFVFHTTEEALVKEVKTVLKKYAGKDWNGEIKKRFNTEGKEKVMVSHGIWKEGENRFVDKYIFKNDSVKLPNSKHFPYLGMEGKILKKAPEELADVKAQVTSDYQDYKEKEWIKHLREKSSIKVNDDVVETINREQ